MMIVFTNMAFSTVLIQRLYFLPSMSVMSIGKTFNDAQSGQRKNLLHNILHIPLQTILTLLVILFAPDYVIHEPFLSLICTDQLKYVRDELIWHGRRKEMH